MNDNTQTDIMQEELTPEDAKGSLGLATRLQEQHLMSMVPTSSVDGETAPTAEEGAETPQEPQADQSAQLEGKMDEKMEIMRTELKSTIKTEVDSIKDLIRDALNEQE